MKYNNEARLAKSIENRNKIIETALNLINEKGFDNVSISEITKAAGVSKGAFYIHFDSKEDLIDKQISMWFDEAKLDGDYSNYEKLKYFILKSIEQIKTSGLKMCQVWFSHANQGSFHGKSKLAYDRNYFKSVTNSDNLADEIISVYYGALNLWCFSDGAIEPENIVLNYLKKYKEEK